MLILCAAVTLWVGGFDVLLRLPGTASTTSRRDSFSVPKRFGIARALTHCPRHARRNDRAAGLAGGKLPLALARLDRDRRGGRRCSPTSIHWFRQTISAG